MDNRTFIPKNLQGVFWSFDINQLDLGIDKVYIIHQILVFGNSDCYKWLFSIYSWKEVMEVFLKSPMKIYPASIFHYVSNYLFRIDNIDEKKYVVRN